MQVLIKPQKDASTKSETYSEPSWTPKRMEPFAILRSSYISDVLLCSEYIYEKILLIKHAISKYKGVFPE